MRKRREPVSPGVVIGLVASLLAFDLRCAGHGTEEKVAAFWLIGLCAPLFGCMWVRQKRRSEGRGVWRSVWITVTMGAIAGTFVFPIVGTIYGAVFTAMFIMPPTAWIAFLSVRGFKRSREGSFARTIWWRRRWHATVAICGGAIAVRLYLAPATPYALGMSAGMALIAVLCLWSLTSIDRELSSLMERIAPAPGLVLEGRPAVDLGVGESVYAMTAPVGEGAYRGAMAVSGRAVGDATVVAAMMRHTLWGALALLVFALLTLGAATVSLYAI